MMTKTKKYTSLALTLVVFTTIMITGTIVSVVGNTVFAFGDHFFFQFNHHHSKKSHIHQSISQQCDQIQRSRLLSAGANSPRFSSGNNIASCTNVNLGGNAAANNQ